MTRTRDFLATVMAGTGFVMLLLWMQFGGSAAI